MVAFIDLFLQIALTGLGQRLLTECHSFLEQIRLRDLIPCKLLDAFQESANHRQALQTREAGTTALTRGFTGRLARGIKNQLLDDLNRDETEILPYPLQRALVSHLTRAAEKAGRRELLQLWAGQSARLSHCEDVNAFLSNLVTQVSEIAGSVQRWSAATRASQPQPEIH